MANGEPCVHCGCQETTHEHPEYAAPGVFVCPTFESVVRHHEDCPVLDCNGDCKQTIRRRDWRGELEAHRARHVLIKTRRGFAVVDIGS